MRGSIPRISASAEEKTSDKSRETPEARNGSSLSLARFTSISNAEPTGPVGIPLQAATKNQSSATAPERQSNPRGGHALPILSGALGELTA